MQLVARPYLFPGVPLQDFQSPNGYVDTMCEAGVGGRIYLAEQSVLEAARCFGMLTAKEADLLRAEIVSLKATVESLGRHLKERDPLFQALKKAIADDSPIEALV